MPHGHGHEEWVRTHPHLQGDAYTNGCHDQGGGGVVDHIRQAHGHHHQQCHNAPDWHAFGEVVYGGGNFAG